MNANPALIELQNTVFKNFNIPVEDILKLKIFHYIKYDHFIKSIENGTLFFDRVINWKDKYENFLFNAQINVNGAKFSFNKFAPWGYAKCFSMEEESFAMWKIREDDYIKYETTVQDVFNSIYSSGIHKYTNVKNLTIRIGKVEYKTKNEIISFYKNKLISYHDFMRNIGIELLDSMFIKRIEYKFEEELRACILFENYSSENLNPLILNSDKFYSSINSIIFHPDVPVQIFNERKEYLNNRGFRNIKKSDILENEYLKINIKNK